MNYEGPTTLGSLEGFYRAVGTRIASKRRSLNITQQNLAEAVGLSRTSLTNIERGGQRVLAHTVFKIALELGVGVGDLLPSTTAVRPLDRMDEPKRSLLQRALSSSQSSENQ